jgi:hypothetical protein
VRFRSVNGSGGLVTRQNPAASPISETDVGSGYEVASRGRV